MKKYSHKAKMFMSVVALLLIITLSVGVTFSWVEGGKTGRLDGNGITISSGSDLTMRQDGVVTSSIIIPSNTLLYETSSADGRNYFFPMGDNTSSDTKLMTFREGTPQDENTKYISVDFQLEAGSTAPDVYFGSGTVVKCNKSDVAKALRLSFYKNDGSEPTVFKPSQMPGVSGVRYSPITAVDSDGKATTTATSTNSFGDYYFKGVDSSTPIFNMKKDQVLNLTLSVWLEGTEFSGNSIADAEISIYIDFTTIADDLSEYYFVDNTHGYSNALPEYWITNTQDKDNFTYETMMYVYDVSSERYYAMTKSKTYSTDHTWYVYVPRSVKSFTFRRYSIDLDIYWNEWEPDMTIAANGSTYIAICGKRNADSSAGWEANIGPCGGYWQDSNNTIRVFFELKTSAGWGDGDPNCYVWTNENKYPLGSWPGTTMTYSHSTSDGKIFFVDIPVKSGEIHGIQFNNSKNTDTKFSLKNDNVGTKYFFNGFIAWYGNSQTGNDYEYINTNTKNCGVYLYQGVLNNPLWNSTTIYAKPIYSEHYLYAYDSNNNYITAWHGNFMYPVKINNTTYYKISILIDSDYSIIVNNNKSDTKSRETSIFTVEPGKTYLVSDDKTCKEFSP